ncbi:BC1872 family protein [Heyndrickxia sporothermodurans]|uniref:BC1872 family protein n=1 Tax=Heyndrickxia sporothermodurans TaxID=46224 RepID=UPI002E24C3A4|nr:hypothetical protein [Heyndrickxia sporothermodurans]MED3697398.1 hypothetical protein [Heyndrickxia sporothermodurans]
MDNREIDKLIALNIMGWNENQIIEMDDYSRIAINDSFVPFEFSPSTDIKDAWLIVEKLSKASDFELSKDCDDSFYICEFLFALNKVYVSRAETAPMAICLAALRTIG